MKKHQRIVKKLVLSIFLLNIFIMAIPIESEGFENSDHLFVSVLRAIGLEPKESKTFHQVPSLTDSISSSTPQDQSYSDQMNFRLSDYFTPGWADTRWQYRKNITIDSTKVSADLTNFPVYIEIYDSDLQNDAQAGGGDVFFTNASGHILDHELELYERVYNSTHAHLVAWVEANISGSQNTLLSMYYGNPTAISQENPTGVWDQNYEFVLHMNQDPSTSKILDSTSNSYDFTVETSASMDSDDLVDGQTGKSLAFDGVDDYIYLPISEGFNGPTDKMTLEFWLMLPNGWSGGSSRFLASTANTEEDPYLWFYDEFDFHIETNLGSDTLSSTQTIFTAGNWYYFTCVWETDTIQRIYIEGALDNEAGTPHDGTHISWNTFSIGAEDDNADGPGGSSPDKELYVTIGEFRLSSTVRSAGWISTEYNNQKDPTTFYSIEHAEKYVESGGWHFSGLKYRKEIILDGTKVSGSNSLLNFPVLIDIYDSDLHDTNKVQTDGDDILFCDAVGRKLDHEIDLFDQNYNPSQAHLVAWVKMPNLTNKDTPIFMYFGNKDLNSQENPTRVWNSGYNGVWHLSESSGDAIDSTTYETNGTINSGATQGVTGQIDGAYDFDGTNNGVTIGNPSDGHLDFGTESFSISFWINIDQSTETYQIPVYKGGTTTSSEGYEVETNQVASALEFGISDGLGNRENSQIPISFDEWIYFTGIVDRTTDKLHVYKNGVEVGTGIDISSVGSIDNGYTMSFSQGSNPFDGILDEVRISSVIRTDDWINTEYTNHYNPSAFYSVKSLESRGNWTLPYLRYNKNLTIDHSMVSGSGDLTNFPILLDFYDSDLHDTNKVQANGNDIAFTDENGIRLDHEIELFEQTFNLTHAHLIAWIGVPVLKGTTDTEIFMWYGNSVVTSLANPDGLWGNYGGVWHLDDDFLDSTLNNNDGTNYQSTDISGQIIDGQDFDGTDDYINSGSGSSLDNVFNGGGTISVWIHPEGWGGASYGRILDKSATTGGTNGWVLCLDGVGGNPPPPYWENQLLFYRDFSNNRGLWMTGDDSITLDQWQYIVVTYDDSSTSNDPIVFINGVLQTVTEDVGETPSGSASDDAAQSLYFGNFIGGGRAFDGGMDEVRICVNSLSAEWIQTEYNNQFNPENYVSIGNEEDRLWADASFVYAKDIIINHTNVVEDLVNFPMLLDITDSGLKSGIVQSTGADILFCDPFGRKFNHEIESFTQTSTNGHLIAWVRIPYLYSSDFTAITMYYGNAELSEQQNPKGVWDYDYKGVWHLQEDPSSSAPQFIDSTSNNNNGTAVSLTTTNQVPGQIDGSLSFDDTDRNVDIPDDVSLKLNSDLCVSAWARTTDTQTDVDVILAKWTPTPPGQNYFLGKLNENTFSFYVDSAQHVDISLSKINDGDWHYVVGIADSTNNQLSLYVDGIQEGTVAYDGSSVTGTSNLYIGQSPGITEQEWNGGIDECRISNVIHSGNWIVTEYNNQYDPSLFYSIASEFTLDVNPPVVNDFGGEDLGTGTGKYWADVTDAISEVNSVTIKINNTDHSMVFNGTVWIYQTSVNYGDYYEFQIVNASDVRGNFLQSASGEKQVSFTADTVAPSVNDWDYFPDEGEYGTFKANVSDSWGEIDTVIINVTQGSVPQGERWAIMRLSFPNYINDTIIMNSGSIKFVVTVNDTAGNSYTSSEHQGYVPIVNHFPVATDLTLSRSQTEILLPIYSNSTLYLEYTFYDQDDDSEGGTEIRWYKNGIRQTAYDNQKQVPASALIRGDDWNATVRPKDGQDFGTINSTSTISIQNTPPTATGILIAPGTPVTASILSVSYTYSDTDGDSQNFSKREILWYKDDILQVNLNNSLTVNSGNTTKNEQWYYQIRVYDSINYSIWFTSNTVSIANSIPSASSLQITPSNPKTSDGLIASYVFSDDDIGDIESGSYIRWYKNGILQGALNDSLSVDSSFTTKGENWYFTIQPSDGSSYGILKTSSSIQIVNTPPTASNLTITSNPLTGDNLEASYTFSDADNDIELANSWIIHWYKNGVLQSTYNDLKTLPSSATSKGEIWNYTVKVYDGTSYSIQYNSSTTTILNTPPTASGLTITTNPPTTTILTASWTFADADVGDTEPADSWMIHWYKDGNLQSTYDNEISVPSSATTKGEVWNYSLQVFDGTMYSILYSSPSTQIQNTAPTASALTLTPLSPYTTDELVGDWTYNDVDSGDTEITYYINWTRGTTHQSAYDGDTTVPSSATLKNQVWYFTLIVFDGTANSTLYTSPSVEIQNTAPTASAITLSPSNPNTSSILIAGWMFADDDPGDSESTLWIVRWYKNGMLQAAYNDLKTVPSSAITKEQLWNFTVQVYDGTNYSVQYSSPMVSIMNSPPIVTDITITSFPKTSDNLIAAWTAADSDGDNPNNYLDDTIIHWFNWTGSVWEEIISLTNTTTIGAGNTTKGESWYYSLQVFDGTNYSVLYNSSNTTIINSFPTVTNPTFNKSSGVTSDDTINITYGYNDADSDLEDIGSRIVYWYNGGVHVPSKDNHTILYYTDTLPDQFWQYILRVYDNSDYSQNYSSSLILIGGGTQENDPPEAHDISLTANSNTTTENLQASYTYYDANGNLQTAQEIRWYKNGALQPSLNDLTVISASYTAKQEKWNFTLRVSDGLDWSIQYNSSLLTIQNSIPEASELVSPSFPKTTEDLVINWTFSDADTGDSQVSSSVKWFINGLYHSEYNNFTTISASETSKGEMWNYTLIVYDGENYSPQYNSSVVTILNTKPTASDISLTVSPTTNSTLMVTYTYTDADNDPESGNWIIRWYKDEVLQPTLNNTKIVTQGNTSKNEFWRFTLQVFDGEEYSISYNSPSRKILNTAPTLSVVSLSSNPQTTDDLIADWIYYDADGDTESTTRVLYWYKDGLLQPVFNNTKSLPASATTKGDIWNYTVKVFDGTHYSTQYNSSTVLILNSAPIASNLIITVQFPKTTDDLIAEWDYIDADNDIEIGTEIMWYKNGELQGPLNGSFTVDSSNTITGEEWHFKVRPFDGTDFGMWINCPMNITIGNTSPVASVLQISPTNPKTEDDLNATYVYFDIDGDPQSGACIRWFLNGIEQTSYENQSIIPSSVTLKGQNWYFNVEPFDGIEFGLIKTSVTVTIGNTVPTATNVQFSPTNPTSNSELTVTYTFTDQDLDLQTGTQIRWYKNNILQSTYNDLITVDSSSLSKSDLWNVSIKVSDGVDYSSWINASINILNSKPEVVDLTAEIYLPLSGLFTTSTLTAVWDEFDDDDDPILDNQIRWFQDGIEVFSLANQTEIPSSYTSKHEEWRFRVRIFDGELWSDWSSDATRTISNSEPLVENITLSGGLTTIDEITLNFDYFDSDYDNQYTQVDWKIIHGAMINTVTVFTTTGNASLSNNNFAAGDLVWVVITPDDSDGPFKGDSVDSSTLSGSEVMKQVGNTAPQINTTLGLPLILSDHPNGSYIYTATIPLYVNYSSLVYDIDSGESDEVFDILLQSNDDVTYATTEEVVGAQYRWFWLNTTSNTWILQEGVTTSVIDSFYLHRDQQWKVSVKPRDQYGYYGSWVNSTPITIGNSYPYVESFNWIILTPTTLDNLQYTFVYADYDNDLMDPSKTLILWFKNGQLISGTENQSMLSSIYFERDDELYVIIRPSDGTNWALTNFTSSKITIINSPPVCTNLVLFPALYNGNEVLFLNWTFNDPDGDSENPTWLISWFKNGVLQNHLRNNRFIDLSEVNNGELWQAILNVYDGIEYSSEENTDINTKKIAIAFEFDQESSQTFPHIRTDEFYVEDENISISFWFSTPNDALGSLIQWFHFENGSWIEKLEFENNSVVPHQNILAGDQWRSKITPYEISSGYFWKSYNSSDIIIESRPIIHTLPSDITSALTDVEGHYYLTLNTTDSRNNISEVLIRFNDGNPYYATRNPTNGLWTIDYQIDPILFVDYLNIEINGVVIVTSQVSYGTQFEIYQTMPFNFTVQDIAAPRVIEAGFAYDKTELNPSNITFYAEIQEYGLGIDEVSIYYYFVPVNETNGNLAGLGSSPLQSEYHQLMQLENSTNRLYRYYAIIPFKSNSTSWKVIYRISTLDLAGNADPVAFDVQRDDPDSIESNFIPYTPPGLPDWVLYVAAFAILLIFAGSVVYIKFIRKPELVGLDKELVLKSMADINESEITDSVDLHTIGVVISFFDQRHGPIPIIVVPDILRDNFTKLVELSDRSFSGTGFSDDFNVEISSSYDFVLTQGIRTKVMSFGYALDVPEARGGQENITANILIHSELFPLVNQFLNEIQNVIHEIHLLMNDQSQGDDLVKQKVIELRNYVSRIILTYEHIYGTTELISEDT